MRLQPRLLPQLRHTARPSMIPRSYATLSVLFPVCDPLVYPFRSVVSSSSSTLSRHTLYSHDSGTSEWLSLESLVADVAVRVGDYLTVSFILRSIEVVYITPRRASGPSQR